METDNLKSFVFLAECKTYKEAADRLFCSPSTLTNRIRKLEKDLHVNLVSHQSPFGLTEEGKSLLPDIKAVLTKVTALEEHASQLAQKQHTTTLVVHEDLRYTIPFEFYSKREAAGFQSNPSVPSRPAARFPYRPTAFFRLSV